MLEDVFSCPISLEVMREPVVLEDGFTYEKASIEGWFAAGHSTSPMTNVELASLETFPNHVLRKLIGAYTDIKRAC